MEKLGVSIYVDKSSEEEILDYIKLASKHGFNRIFSCLISISDTKENIMRKFKKINKLACELGFEIIIDISPKIFNTLNIDYKDLSFFKEIGAHGIRLDIGFTGLEESLMTFNDEGLKIEINMSNDTNYIDTILNYEPNKKNLIGCHNFYPHNFSGLTIEHFTKCTERFKKYGLKTAAFISCENKEAFGPWIMKEGLPTLEIHRNLPIHVQAKHLIAIGNIDDIIISNCYATEREFEELSKLRKDMVEFKVILNDNIPEIERKIILEELHFRRGDISEYIIRSTQSRVKYKYNKFNLFNTPKIIKRGDIIIESSEYGHYAGEIQIALKDMINSGKSNVAGKIVEEEVFILDYIKPWQKFKFNT